VAEERGKEEKKNGSSIRLPTQRKERKKKPTFPPRMPEKGKLLLTTDRLTREEGKPLLVKRGKGLQFHPEAILLASQIRGGKGRGEEGFPR